MSEQVKPTQTPWHLGPHYKYDIESRDGHIGGTAYTPQGIANAAFIVTACNSHNDLVKALENLIAAVKPMEGAPYWQDHEDLINAKEVLAEVTS